MATSPEPIIVIEPPRGWIPLNVRELWQGRELLLFFAWRDVAVRYKQSLLGFAWAVIVPLANMLVFGTIFGRVAGLESNGISHYLFYMAGLVPWQYFSNSVTQASNSLVGYSHLLTKIYLPRLYIPMGSCIANIVDFLLAFLILLLMMFAMGAPPAATIVFVPFLVAMAGATALGIGLLLSAMNVKYRDVKFLVPFMTQMWMYASVLLPYTTVRARLGDLAWVYGLNPMAGVIEGIRWCLLHPHMFVDKERTIPVPPPWDLIATGLPAALALLVFGLYYFKRMEKMFADIV